MTTLDNAERARHISRWSQRVLFTGLNVTMLGLVMFVVLQVASVAAYSVAGAVIITLLLAPLCVALWVWVALITVDVWKG